MRKKLHLRYWIAFGFLALLLMSFIVWNINSGSIEISVREIMEILFLGKGVRKSELPFPFFHPGSGYAGSCASCFADSV